MTGVLVSGAASGLGRFLHRTLGGDGLTRANAEALLAGPGAGLIVHCAPDAALAERLLALPHERFVLASSVGVLGPRDAYAAGKLAEEEAVLARARRPLVLRLGALLGADARPNSLSRLVAGAPLTVTAGSSFLWLGHEAVGAFLTAALERGLEGTYNVVPSRSATMAEAARALGLCPAWGAFEYRTPEADGSAARAVCPDLSRTALENAILFARERRP